MKQSFTSHRMRTQWDNQKSIAKETLEKLDSKLLNHQCFMEESIREIENTLKPNHNGTNISESVEHEAIPRGKFIAMSFSTRKTE